MKKILLVALIFVMANTIAVQKVTGQGAANELASTENQQHNKECIATVVVYCHRVALCCILHDLSERKTSVGYGYNRITAHCQGTGYRNNWIDRVVTGNADVCIICSSRKTACYKSYIDYRRSAARNGIRCLT